MLFCLVFLSFLEKGEGWRLLEVIESGEPRHPLRRKELAFFTVSCVAHGAFRLDLDDVLPFTVSPLHRNRKNKKKKRKKRDERKDRIDGLPQGNRQHRQKGNSKRTRRDQRGLGPFGQISIEVTSPPQPATVIPKY